MVGANISITLRLHEGMDLAANDQDDTESNDIECLGSFPSSRHRDLCSNPRALSIARQANQQSSTHPKIDLRSYTPTRKSPFLNAAVSIRAFWYNGIELKAGVEVEFLDGSFMRITEIFQEVDKLRPTVHGSIFYRNSFMGGMLDVKVNEICWVLYINKDDSRDPSIQGMKSVSVSSILRKRSIFMTNRPYHDFYADAERMDGNPLKKLQESGPLVCRYKYVCIYNHTKPQSDHHWYDGSLCRIQAVESDSCFRVADDELRQIWRGETVKGGACNIYQLTESVITRDKSQSHDSLDTHEVQPSCATSLASMRRRGVAPMMLDLELVQESDLLYHDDDLAGIIFKERSSGIHSICRESAAASSSQSRNETVPFNYLQTHTKPQPVWLNEDNFIDLTDEEQNKKFRLSLKPKGTQDLSCPSKQKRSIIHLQSDSPVYNKRVRRRPVLEPSLYQLDALTAVTMTPKISQRDNLPQYRYTFGDCFCGAGGMSRGAVQAGLQVEWGFDFNFTACQSYKLNFRGTKVFNIGAAHFTNLFKEDHKVDICHISPPCQYFSHAHTTVGKDDEMNIISLFAIGPLLSKTKPRVVTLEQTSGLLTRHWPYFCMVANMFTNRGFSIRWRLLELADYGIPQCRKRLIMIASCPGETLPNYPEPTHSFDPRGTGLKPWATINSAIARIPWDWPNHKIATLRTRNEIPYDGNTQAFCVTAAASGLYHPSGKRSFTHREIAGLQGFPLEHKFSDWQVRRQIGNAVPPVFATALLKEVKRALMQADGISEDDEHVDARMQNVL